MNQLGTTPGGHMPVMGPGAMRTVAAQSNTVERTLFVMKQGGFPNKKLQLQHGAGGIQYADAEPLNTHGQSEQQAAPAQVPQNGQISQQQPINQLASTQQPMAVNSP